MSRAPPTVEEGRTDTEHVVGPGHVVRGTASLSEGQPGRLSLDKKVRRLPVHRRWRADRRCESPPQAEERSRRRTGQNGRRVRRGRDRRRSRLERFLPRHRLQFVRGAAPHRLRHPVRVIQLLQGRMPQRADAARVDEALRQPLDLLRQPVDGPHLDLAAGAALPADRAPPHGRARQSRAPPHRRLDPLLVPAAAALQHRHAGRRVDLEEVPPPDRDPRFAAPAAVAAHPALTDDRPGSRRWPRSHGGTRRTNPCRRRCAPARPPSSKPRRRGRSGTRYPPAHGPDG